MHGGVYVIVYVDENNKDWKMNSTPRLQSLLRLHGLASEHNDANLQDFLESEYLQEQVDAIKEIADHVTNLERVGEGLGVYMFDKELRE